MSVFYCTCVCGRRFVLEEGETVRASRIQFGDGPWRCTGHDVVRGPQESKVDAA